MPVEFLSKHSLQDTEKGGFITEPGWYSVTVAQVQETPMGGCAAKITFVCNRGPWAGSKFSHMLFMPKGSDQEKQETSERLFLLNCARLGVWDGDTGNIQLDFNKCRGGNYVVKIVQKPDKQYPEIPAGQIYPWGHDKIPQSVQKVLDGFGQQAVAVSAAKAHTSPAHNAINVDDL